ncbi:MAG TPA: HU family DNA-binding protein, partial [Anaerolineales bacterium]|nr:HU family DNA-binding protein [Anaerolineales bacterium]
MPVRFTVNPKKDPRDQTTEPKYYAIAKSNGRADTHNIAKSINNMSTVSSVDTAAVLEAFLTVVPEKLAEGNIVELGDFGSFRISLSSEGAALAEEVTARSITDTRVIFTPGKRFKQVLGMVEFQKESAN